MFIIRRVHGSSMMPGLQPGKIVTAVLRFGSLKKGDVIVVRHAGVEKIKRLVDLDVDKIYLEGDNKAQSTDSRHFGWLDKASIRGKVIWPRNIPAKLKYPR